MAALPGEAMAATSAFLSFLAAKLLMEKLVYLCIARQLVRGVIL